MYPVFKNAELEKSITQKGYVVINDFAPSSVCDDLSLFYSEQGTIDERPFSISNWNKDLPQREAVFQKICQTIEPYGLPVLNGYKSVLGVFTAKRPGDGSDMLLHQDWSLVDETQYRSVSIWLALCDMDSTNGNLQVAEYSHLYASQPRGMNVPVPFEELRKEIQQNHLTDLPINKGDAIIFDHRLIHASPVNRSNKIRLAAVLALIPSEASLVHYYKEPGNENELELLLMKDADFKQIDFFDVPNRPKHIDTLDRIPFRNRQLTIEEVLQAERNLGNPTS